MIEFDEIKKYLPQYLSGSSQKALFDELKRFPCNIDSRLYSRTAAQDNVIYQGDGLSGLMVLNLPDTTVKPAPAVVLSNSCDIDPTNKRFFQARAVYAPIFQLHKYESSLREGARTGDFSEEVISQHIEAIRNQFVTQIFYLPKGHHLEYESIVFLDRLNNCSVKDMYPALKDKKLFSLSNYGFYLFLIKLSIHFTRVREGVDREMHAA